MSFAFFSMYEIFLLGSDFLLGFTGSSVVVVSSGFSVVVVDASVLDVSGNKLTCTEKSNPI